MSCDDIHVSECSDEELSQAYKSTWVHRRKPTEVKSRICVQGQTQHISDLDETYASTPVVTTLRLILCIALTLGLTIVLGDISTAFLHANLRDMDSRVLMWAPSEFYPTQDVLWLLKKAMYGLRTSPKDWQEHFASTILDMGFKRLLSEPNLYVKTASMIYILAYVDDLLIIGPEALVQKTLELLKTKFLLKITGNLNDEGSVAHFLGRQLKRVSDSILMTGTPNYYESDLAFFGLSKAKPTTMPGTSGLRRQHDGDEPVSSEEHSAFRRAVGKLQWEVPIRLDIAYSVKELARCLTMPLKEDLTTLKHLLRWFEWMTDYMRDFTTISRR